MTRLFLVSITIVSVLIVIPYVVKAQNPTSKKGALAKSYQVYVKIILPTDPAARDKDRPVVESWIAEQLKNRGQTKFTAATEWVPLASRGEESMTVWYGRLDDKQWACPVTARIAERGDGHVKVLLDGWAADPTEVTVAVKDEPGSREIAAVERPKTDQGLPYVAVLIGPTPEK
jgi:hypothetical protein